MKSISSKLAFLCLLAGIPCLLHATTYYSKASGNANTRATWGTNTDGTGTAPGSFSVSGDIFILRTGSTLNLSGNWTIAAGVTLQIDGNISVTNNNHDITISGTVIFTNTTTTQVSLTGGGNGNNFTVSANATVRTSNQNGLRGAGASLPVTVSGTINLNTNASYEFNGSSTQLTTGLPATVKDLAVNSGTSISLSANTSVTGQLKLQSGILTISPGVILTIPSPGNIIGTAFGVAKHIQTDVSGATKSYVRVNNISGTESIPTGDGVNFLPVTITSASVTSVQFNVFSGLTHNGIPNGLAFSNTEKLYSVDAVYTLQRMAGAGSFDLTLGWPSALEGAQFSSLSNGNIGISTNTGSSWSLPMGSGDNVANTASVTGLSIMGQYAVGKTGSPLYVKFGSISTTIKNNGVSLKWETLTEIDLQKFVIERSADGIHFSSIGEQSALAPNYTGYRYEFFDVSPLAATSFYRIRGIDTDGKFSYSAIIRVNNTNNDLATASIKIYPNPVVNKELGIQATGLKTGAYQVLVTDLNGKQLYSQQIQVNSTQLSQHILLPSAITKGNYVLLVRGNDENSSRMFSVQ